MAVDGAGVRKSLNTPIGDSEKIMRNTIKIALAAAAFAAFASPAAAATSTCNTTTDILNATVTGCAGFYSGNALSGSPTDIATQKAALASLGYTFDGNYSAVTLMDHLAGQTNIDFGTLTGINYIGVHYGNGAGAPAGGNTAFYRIDAGAGLDFFTLGFAQGSSNVALYTAAAGAVPEPATWAMMLLGFGAVGTALSRRKKAAGALQIA